MNEQDKKLCEEVKSIAANFNNFTEEHASLLSAAQAIERLSAELEDLKWSQEAYIAAGKKLQAELAALRKEKEELLCVIHRDGGHYIIEHGVDKAAADGLDVLYEWRTAFDELTTIRAQLAEQEPFGFYEEDFGFNFPGFFSNQQQLIDSKTLIPLYLAPPVVSEDARLREQRDELLAALENITEAFCGRLHEFSAEHQNRAEKSARAAITKAKG